MFCKHTVFPRYYILLLLFHLRLQSVFNKSPFTSSKITLLPCVSSYPSPCIDEDVGCERQEDCWIQSARPKTRCQCGACWWSGRTACHPDKVRSSSASWLEAHGPQWSIVSAHCPPFDCCPAWGWRQPLNTRSITEIKLQIMRQNWNNHTDWKQKASVAQNWWKKRPEAMTKLLVMTVLQLLVAQSLYLINRIETENSTTVTQKRDTTDAWKGKRRAVVRRGTNMVNCLWLPVNGHKARAIFETPLGRRQRCFTEKLRSHFCWLHISFYFVTRASVNSAYPNLSICMPLKNVVQHKWIHSKPPVVRNVCWISTHSMWAIVQNYSTALHSPFQSNSILKKNCLNYKYSSYHHFKE